MSDMIHTFRKIALDGVAFELVVLDFALLVKPRLDKPAANFVVDDVFLTVDGLVTPLRPLPEPPIFFGLDKSRDVMRFVIGFMTYVKISFLFSTGSYVVVCRTVFEPPMMSGTKGNQCCMLVKSI